MDSALIEAGAEGVAKRQHTRVRGFAGIGLFMPKNDLNVGGAMRAADCYGASIVVVQGRRYWNMSSDTTKAHRRIPVINTDGDLFDCIPHACTPIAVELTDDAVSLVSFVHPQRAFYIFGPEDGSLGAKVLDRCKHTVMVPTNFCLNLSACVNVVLYDRMAKQHVRLD